MSIPGVDLKAMVAWDSGFRTPNADRTWTDVSQWVELTKGIEVTYGRGDELGTADANELDLTLDNTDGRFTWGKSTSPYYPNVKIGRPVRLIATVGGVDYVRYTGFANGWPLEWSGGGDTYAEARLGASSRLSRLGLNSPIVDTLDKTLAASDPDLYWPMTEASGTIAAEVKQPIRELDMRAIGTKSVLGISAEEFPLDGRPVAQVSPGQVLVDDVVYSPGFQQSFWGGVAFSGNITFGLFFRTVNPTPFVSGTDFWGFYPDDSTGATGMAVDRPEYSIHPSELEGVHHLAFTREQTSPTTFTLTNYLDGQIIRQVMGTAAPYTKLMRVNGPTPRGSSPIQYGRLAMWDRVLTLAEIAEIADVGLGYAGDTTDERIRHLAAWANIPDVEVITTPSPITVEGIPTEGGQVVELLRQVETAEGGVLYDNRDGNLVLAPRTARYGAPVALELNVDTQDVGSDYAPKVDQYGLANIGQASNKAGTVAVTYSDAASIEEYGEFSADVETIAEHPDEPLLLLAAQINANSQPRPRAPEVTINVLDWIGKAEFPAVMALDVGSKIRIKNAPAQAASTTADYFVEGYTESFGKASWEITLNLSPGWPADQVLILDDAVHGFLDVDLLAL